MVKLGPDKTVDVFGVGNALVDILVLVDHDFVREHDLTPGSMTLVDAEKQGRLLRHLEQHQLELSSGGSAANTIIAVSQSGGTGFYTGKVSRDSHGEFYRQDLLASGIHFDVHPAEVNHGPTGTCLVLTTPDAERTMCTNLGVSGDLGPEDIDIERLGRCKISYVEGYLWGAERPRQACLKAMAGSRHADVRVALSFSDFFLVDRYEADFRFLVEEYCDIVFCNAEEARRFSNVPDLEACAADLGSLVELALITNGPQGCLVVERGRVTHVPGFSARAIDSVGAGDAFAGGTLYGICHGLPPHRAARWGNYLASQVVQIHRARLNGSWADRLGSVTSEPEA
jgi:sugar/nucleoside kinase (ribokinase family)